MMKLYRRAVCRLTTLKRGGITLPSLRQKFADKGATTAANGVSAFTGVQQDNQASGNNSAVHVDDVTTVASDLQRACVVVLI